MKKSFNDLISGYRNFKKEAGAASCRQIKPQSPTFLIISCSDSRVIPNVIFSADPGDLFITRNVANLVPPYETGEKSYHGTSAVIEYAVKILKVKHIIVLGHTNCGGIHFLLDNHADEAETGGFIKKWMDIAAPAIKKTEQAGISKEEKIKICTEEAVKISLDNLQTFPFILQAVKENRLETHGMIFDLSTLKLYEFNAGSNNFTEV